jgi:hypothetical protein
MGQGRDNADQAPQQTLQVSQEDPTQQFGQTMQSQAQRIAEAQKRAMEFRNQFMGQFTPGQGQYRSGPNNMPQRQNNLQPDFMGLLAMLGQGQQQQQQQDQFFGVSGGGN